MLAPECDSAGRWGYTLFAEGAVPAELPARLDLELRRNPHYAFCRDLGQLHPLTCIPVSDAYRIFCESSSDGRRMGDIKPQALSTRTDWRSRFSKSAGLAPALSG